jgi:hypothetical protein
MTLHDALELMSRKYWVLFYVMQCYVALKTEEEQEKRLSGKTKL